MIEADPLTIVTLANDTAHVLAQAGPPSDLPAQVPDFVGELLNEIRTSAGMEGLGETISELTPGGSEAAGQADAAGNAAENAGGL